MECIEFEQIEIIMTQRNFKTLKPIKNQKNGNFFQKAFEIYSKGQWAIEWKIQRKKLEEKLIKFRIIFCFVGRTLCFGEYHKKF